MSFVLPVFRSSFSLLYGTTPPEEIVRATTQIGYERAILADRNNLYGCYDFYDRARESGIRPIIGAGITCESGEFIFLCEDYDGFKNLSRIITHYHLHGTPSMELLKKYRQGLVCLAPVSDTIEDLKGIYGDSFYLIVDYCDPSKTYRLAKNRGFRLAALPSVSFLRKEDYATHRLLRAINGGHLLNNIPTSETAGSEEYLREPEWYGGFFAPFPEAIYGNAEIAEKCRLIFPEKKNILPDSPIEGDHFHKLKNDALIGLQGRFPNPNGRYLSRLEYELSVIQRTGFVDYFLIVGEIIDFCRQNDIACVGRGSAAGSLVSYSLGITEVDPIQEDLCFERFLNEARSDCPDIDIDVDWRRRDEVLDFIYKRYGDDHVAMMATYTRFQSRLAIRETAKALGFDPEEMERFIKHLPNESLDELDKQKIPMPKASKFRLEWKRLEPVIVAARSISGLPRHLGIHSGGIVITPEPLTDYIPLERATKGLVVTQCDMYQAEKIGLVKIDILGQRGLAVIADCYKAVNEEKGPDFSIPPNDPKTYEILRAGKTIGVFQIESPGLRALLRDLGPACLKDITLALALIRPGASESGMKKVFLDRFHKREKTVYPDPRLETVLKETNGVFIYQEQVILAAQQIAGFNLAASDLLRRAITKKRKDNRVEKLKNRFLDGARNNEVNLQTAAGIFNQLGQFASFGFCKAHAATYGYLAYQSAYFKTHFPVVFMTAVLRNGGGYYPSAVYAAEARRLGIEISAPRINISHNSDMARNGTIYLGIARIKEISGDVVAQIERERPFVSFYDFLARISISKPEIENLIKIGFFDSQEKSRPKLLWQYRLWGKRISQQDTGLFGHLAINPKIGEMPLTPTGRYEIFRAETEILEIPASFHPLSLFESYQNSSMVTMLKEAGGSSITITGWLADRKRIKTRNGKAMVFLTFDSLDDTFEVILFPDNYAKYRETIRNYRYLTVKADINWEDGHPAAVAREIYPAPTGLKEAQFI